MWNRSRLSESSSSSSSSRRTYTFQKPTTLGVWEESSWISVHNENTVKSIFPFLMLLYYYSTKNVTIKIDP